MNKIKIFYSEHERKIKILLLAIIVPLIILKTIDYIVKISSENKEKSNDTGNTTISALDKEKQYEAVTGSERSSDIYIQQTNIIKDFLNKCNIKDYEGAYSLLTDDCKQAQYPSINLFIDGYCNNKFAQKQTYSYQLWVNSTYQIKLRNDILTSGIYNENSYVEDYYTVSGEKLNINSYLGKQTVDKQAEKGDITINLKSIDYYRDYVTCTIEAKNSSENEILLYTGENTNDIFFKDSNGVTYSSYPNEINEEDLRIPKDSSKEIKIRFNVTYRNDIDLNKLTFNKIILNYDKYMKNQIEKTDETNIDIII